MSDIIFRSRIELFLAPNTPIVWTSSLSQAWLCVLTDLQRQHSYSLRIYDSHEKEVLYEHKLSDLTFHYSTPGPYYHMMSCQTTGAGDNELQRTGIHFTHEEEAKRFVDLIDSKCDNKVTESHRKVLFNPNVQHIAAVPEHGFINKTIIKKWHDLVVGLKLKTIDENKHELTAPVDSDNRVPGVSSGVSSEVSSGVSSDETTGARQYKYRDLWRKAIILSTESAQNSDHEFNENADRIDGLNQSSTHL